jgi:hypothetical protein
MAAEIARGHERFLRIAPAKLVRQRDELLES